MRSYRFRFVEGQSAPYKTLEARNDADFYIQLRKFLAAAPLRSLISGSIEYTERGRVPDPPPSCRTYEDAA
jgi:hypothetical protein